MKKIILAVGFACMALLATGAEEAPAAPPPGPKPEMGLGSGPGPESAPGKRSSKADPKTLTDRRIWRIMGRLPAEERQKMGELQKTNPEEFRKVMQAKLDALQKQEQEFNAKLKALVEKFKKAEEKEKEEIKVEVSRMISEDYQRKLDYTRRSLEDAKKQVERLSTGLAQREANAAKAVEARVNSLLKTGAEKPKK